MIKTVMTVFFLDEECSERDSGTGDSKRSQDNMENNIVDHVIHNFLSARGESQWGVSVAGTGPDHNITSLSDLDTGISNDDTELGYGLNVPMIY